jgi:prepilin-type N-terminal cleavage/methylation domain-containing protein
MTKLKNEKGFTLIELLVVIAIIGILSSVVLVSLGTARSKARDANRTSDLKSIQTALVLYADEHNNTYPTSTPGTVTGIPTADIDSVLYSLVSVDKRFGLNVLPKDPLTGVSYYYYVYEDGNGICSKYHLGADMENDNNAVLAGDSDFDSAGATTVICGTDSNNVPFDGDETAAGTAGTDCNNLQSDGSAGYCYDLTE